MRIQADDTVTITFTLTTNELDLIMGDFDKSHEPSLPGKALYSTLATSKDRLERKEKRDSIIVVDEKEGHAAVAEEIAEDNIAEYCKTHNLSYNTVRGDMVNAHRQGLRLFYSPQTKRFKVEP